MKKLGLVEVVHDSKQAVPFLREVIDDLRRQLGRRVALEFRMDAAFFQRGILTVLATRDCGYAIKVGYWSWLPLKAIAAACRRWAPVAPDVTGYVLLFGTLLGIPGVGGVREQRERLTVRIAPDALRPVAEVFGFRKPARAVDLPQEATRSRASR